MDGWGSIRLSCSLCNLDGGWREHSLGDGPSQNEVDKYYRSNIVVNQDQSLHQTAQVIIKHKLYPFPHFLSTLVFCNTARCTPPAPLHIAPPPTRARRCFSLPSLRESQRATPRHPIYTIPLTLTTTPHSSPSTHPPLSSPSRSAGRPRLAVARPKTLPTVPTPRARGMGARKGRGARVGREASLLVSSRPHHASKRR
jgi:hypothetical protein